MAEGLDFGRLRGMLECNICLEQYDNPKMLKCTHEFCKRCLEGIVTFRSDGSAAIACPLRCDEQTILHENQTVNDLSASYNFKNILEVLKLEDKKSSDLQMPVCAYNENCTKHISLFCCGNMLCNTCYLSHVKTEGDHQKVNLSFNKREDLLMVLCDKHVSVCNYLCADNKFLCMYCMHRDSDHKQHVKNTVESEVRLLKEALGNELSEKEKIQQFQTITQQNILLAKENFESFLQQRKEECKAQYNDFLNEEEEQLKKNFQAICDSHMKEYSCGLSAEYYQVMLDKRDVELVLQKEEILDAIENKSTLKSETVSLTGTDDFLGGRPLGEIRVVGGEDVPVKDPPVSTLKHTLETSSKKSYASTGTQADDGYKVEVEVSVVMSPTVPDCDDIIQDMDLNDSALRDAQGFKLRGNEYFKKRMYDKAMECYTKAIDICPSENDADLSIFYQNRAAVNEELKQWTEVVRDCNKAIKLNPKYCKALHRRARGYEAMDRKRDCFADATAAGILEGFKNEEGVKLADKMGKAIGRELAADYFHKRPFAFPSLNFIKKYLGSFNNDPFTVPIKTNEVEDNIYSEIMQCMKNEDYETVLNLCTEEINACGRHKNRAILLRGTMKMFMCDVAGAIKDFNAIVSLDDNKDNKLFKVDALIKRAAQKFDILRDVVGCFSDYGLAVILDPDNANIYCHRGGRYLKVQYFEEAKDDLKKAVSLDATFVEPRILLGSCLCDIATQKMSPLIMKEGNDILDETTRLFPNYAEAWSVYGERLTDQVRCEEASVKIEKALSLAPHLPATYLHKATLILKWKEDLTGAVKLVRKAIELDEKFYFAYTLLGSMDMEWGNYEEAAKNFERSIMLVSTEAEMANAFASLGAAKTRIKFIEDYGIIRPAYYHEYSKLFR